MSAAITVVHQAELVEREPEGIRFTADERSMIREAYARGADESTFRVLVAIAEARGLDPRKGMVHFVERGGRWSVQPSIDYFRSAADATGLYDGQDQPEFEHEGGRLVSATVRVWRKGWSRPMVGYARFSEFDAGSPMWRKMPHNQLAKCAESQALRKAFPKRLGGLYTPDEMEQADRAAGSASPTPLPPHDAETGEVVEEPRKAPGQRASELASAIEACTEAMGLDVVGRRVSHAAKAGEITLDQAADLKERGKRKRKDLALAAEQAARAKAGAELDAMGDLAPGWGGDVAPAATATRPPSTPPPAQGAPLSQRAEQYRRALEGVDHADAFAELWGLVQADHKAGKVTREEYDALTIAAASTERRLGVGGPR